MAAAPSLASPAGEPDMVFSSPVLQAQAQPSSSEGERNGGEPDLLWLADLTGAHLGLAPISQDPEDRCSIWENLVSLVDFHCPGFPLTSEELRHYITIPRTATSRASTATVTTALPPAPAGDIDYRSDARAKPPYSYATLICMAMQASKKPKITLAAICKWISDNFSYFRRGDPTWQSSIRHNLCINKRFVKVPREKGEPGRGAFWKLHPWYAEQLRNGPFSELGALPELLQPSSPRAAQQPARRAPSPAALSSQRSLKVGAELQRLLQEFEEFESSHNGDPVENNAGQQRKQPRPTAPAEASWLGSAARGAQEGQQELPEPKDSPDWGSLLNTALEQGDFSALEHLEPPAPAQCRAAQGPHTGWPHGQQQIHPKPSPTKPGLDETLMAAAFLEAAWPEESGENLPSCIGVEQGAGNLEGSLSEEDIMDWESLSHLRLY